MEFTREYKTEYRNGEYQVKLEANGRYAIDCESYAYNNNRMELLDIPIEPTIQKLCAA